MAKKILIRRTGPTTTTTTTTSGPTTTTTTGEPTITTTTTTGEPGPTAGVSSLSATALDYNQVQLTYTEEAGNQWGYDVELSWDSGSTWHWYRRVLTDALCLSHTGRAQSGAIVLAGLAAATGYQFRMRGVYPDDDREVFSGWSNVATVTTPAYRTGPSYPTREGGDGATVFSVTDSTSWTTAQQNCRHGDFIDIAVGYFHNVGWVQPPQTGGTDGYVTIRTAGYQRQPYQRVSLAAAANMGGFDSLVVNTACFSTRRSVDRYSLEGVLFKHTATVFGGLVITGCDATVTTTVSANKNELPFGIEWHGCLFINDADSKINQPELLWTNGHYLALQDCILDAAHLTGGEPKAVLSLNGACQWYGNSELQATGGMAALSGGSGKMFLHDLFCQVWHRIYITRDPAWFSAQGDYPVKNLIEWKDGQWVHVSGGVFEHAWAVAQQMGILITPRSFGDQAAGTERYYFSYNKIQECHGGFMLDNVDQTDPVEKLRYPTRRIVIEHNLLDLIQDEQWTPQQGNTSYSLEFSGGFNPSHPADVGQHIYCRHNTCINRNSTGERDMFCLINPNVLSWIPPITVEDNVLYGSESTGIVIRRDGGSSDAKAELDAAFGTGWVWRNNAQYTENPPTTDGGSNNGLADFPALDMPGCQFFNAAQGGIAGILFTNAAARDYTLQAGSPLKAAASDGTDIGANMPVLNTRILHTVDGDWT